MLQASNFRILNCFLSENTLGFAEVCKLAGYPTDLGGYYLRQLISEGYLEKSDRGKYTVTAKGKREIALRYGKPQFHLRPRLVALLVASREGRYVVLDRKTQPFIGTTEWPASNILFGEALADGATRTLKERCNVDGKPEFAGFFRRIDMYKDMLFDDKMFAVHTYTLHADDTIAQSSQTGANAYCSEEELRALEHPGKALLDILDYVKRGDGELEERTYQLEPDGLSSTE